VVEVVEGVGADGEPFVEVVEETPEQVEADTAVDEAAEEPTEAASSTRELRRLRCEADGPSAQRFALQATRVGRASAESPLTPAASLRRAGGGST